MKRFLLSSLLVVLAGACSAARGQVIDLTTKHAEGQVSRAKVLEGGTAKVAMTDFRFTPSSFTVKAGTTVRFVFSNLGAVPHQALIGDEDLQLEYEAAMSPETQVKGQGVIVGSGETGSLAYTFAKPGTLLIGCHEPGHWDAGMLATIRVTP